MPEGRVQKIPVRVLPLVVMLNTCQDRWRGVVQHLFKARVGCGETLKQVQGDGRGMDGARKELHYSLSRSVIPAQAGTTKCSAMLILKLLLFYFSLSPAKRVIRFA